jgi:hypothetical protein
MLSLLVAGAFGFLLGAAITSILYERNLIGMYRRSSNVNRISQLDIFEIPEKMRSSRPPKPSEAPPTTPEK